jgi:hypothetical protein
MRDRSRRQCETVCHHGCRTFEEYKSRTCRSETRPRHGISISAPRQGAYREARFSLQCEAQSDFCARMLLAPTSSMLQSVHTEDTRRLLANEIRSKRGQGQKNRPISKERKLEGFYRMAMRIERRDEAREATA